jgi:signal transduction histidine kinase/ActR/RegA family two-component response regulator
MLYVRSDLNQLNDVLFRNLSIASVVLLVCLLLAYALGTSLERMISRPIISLVKAARGFSIEQNTFVRAEKGGQDELGELVDAFNEMVGRIESDLGLEQRRERLEGEVATRARLNEELQREKERAEAATKSKTDFLANMSHEIRTPMTAILGYIDLLADPDQSAIDQASCYETIRRNGRHLLSIINDILDLSKVEAGQLMVERLRCSPVEIVGDVAALMRQRAESKGLRFEVEWGGPIAREIETDPTRLRQILMNLVGNAVKFTSEGSVVLRGSMIAGENGRSGFRFDVIDSGVGLKPEQIARVFDPFQQADTSTTRKFGGTGLGLAISKRLAEALGGTITLTSVYGEGTTFSVTIDAGELQGVELVQHPSLSSAPAPAAEQPAAQGSREQIQGRILVAEDGPDNQRLIRAFLSRVGLVVQIAQNGREAVDAALAAWGAGEPFDVILMDMQMPEMDGYEATRTLREEGYTGPIIALTAQAMKGTREGCLAAGCDDYTTKPIQRDKLVQLVRDMIAKRSTAE